MTTFALGRKTIINECSVEYDWIRRQVEEGTETEEIINSILCCFGGDEEIAVLFYSIAVGESSPGVLLTHLSLSDWSPSQGEDQH
ncbi:hypothetical protein K6Q96_20550 [Grimontia kaedaensis]|uniref:Uncharacterized protein n=1 Tax=Grimontia kaedaensis TaxID=2872157 RepID=A0ABY4X2Z7_9GAMM|nr:hypothetical protein [Grimontia kaedaensis]USH05585.1 hypothetical protein K6Q96_20550 [Grimontia kaedaensis]